MALDALNDPYLKFRGLISRLEAEATDSPGAYRRRVVALGVAGYAFVVLLLAVGLATLGWGVPALVRNKYHAAVFPVAFFGLSLLTVCLRAMWSRIDKVDGLALQRNDVLELFVLIDKVRRKTRGPRVHRVLIDNELNAGISQRPRLGVLGMYENTLHIGLAYAMNVDVRSFAATLAHEYGHLSGAHGKWSAWIYRMRRSWARMMEHVARDEGSVAGLLILPFVWYWPFFSAYSFVLARQQEYEADSIARELVGGAAVANGLVSCAITSEYLSEEFWPTVYKEADRSPTVSRRPFKEMQVLLKDVGRHPRANEWVKAALGRVADVEDTHPALRDRLEALGQKPALPIAIGRSAAEVLLGPKLQELIDHFDRQWRNEVKAGWKERYEGAQLARERLQRLRSMMEQKTANVDEQFEHACLLERFEGSQIAAPAYSAFVERCGRDPRGYFALGRVLVSEKDNRGFELLRKSVELSSDYAIAAARIAVPLLEREGRFKEAKEFAASADRVYEQHQELMDLAWDFKRGDSYRSHGLTDSELDHLREVVRRERGVVAAYVARKFVPQFRDHVVIMLGLQLKGSTSIEATRDSLVGRLDLRYPVLVIDLIESNDIDAEILDAVERIPGSRLL